MTTANEIRGAFLEFFRRNDHRVVPSSPLVPRNDPTLLFTNAGMVQFKNVFTGAEKRDYQRAASSQKCLRAGGKHNDLENVGYTARHHTFFEMLGNFSFGDYFKERAIELAWTLLTKEFGLPAERLLATVYAEDEDAFRLWKKVAGLPESRIVRIGTSDNFWAMGDTGPCGPCSEIFYDHGEAIPGGPPGSPDAEGDRFVEIWNLVFMQYEQRAPGDRLDLPRPSIDTGMGLERIAAVLQGKHDNYDIDLFRGLIEASAEASHTAPDGPHAVSHRVIADHLRASAFLVADGVLPSNEGRGYVLRRIMRRAMRHAHLLGAKEPLIWRLVPALIERMGAAYPELIRADALVAETLRLEETRFQDMLGRGLRLLEEALGALPPGKPLPGDVAFRLYDTFGFPVDLTQDVLRGLGRGLDMAGFEAAMARQREEARRAWSGSGEQATDRVWFELRERCGATEFLGYETNSAEAIVQALLLDGKEVQSADAGMAPLEAEVAIILNQTPFYAESGGQMGDSGVVFSPSGLELAVSDAQKKADGLFVHFGRLSKGRIAVGQAVELRVDAARRDRLRANHSATHLLHQALRRVLGPHVTQKGSLVAPDRLRFDFSHTKPMTPEELRAVEAEVNFRVRQNAEVGTRLMTPDQAVAGGALALFGEKYGEEVRVVSMGLDEDAHFSVELCGGTHVRRTGDIGFFKITNEGGLASGVRRIEALTGEAAVAHIEAEEATLREAAAALKVAPAELPQRLATLVEERRRLEREVSELRRKLAAGGGAEPAAAREVGGIRYAARLLDGVPARELKAMADALKKQVGSGVVAIAAEAEGRASLVVGVTDDLTDRMSAVDFVRLGAEKLGGKGGGGRPDMAQAGGPDVAARQAALDAIEAALAARAA
jgi:alanyl-tRNA synthetase